jgi:hypothetical protein
VSGYLGYDRCALGVLLGALEAVRDERLPAGPWSRSAAGRQAAIAIDVHRHVASGIAGFADLVGAVLHGDPLGRYRPVALDVGDLALWVVHRGGRWATVTDPLDPTGTSSSALAETNARMVAASLTPERVRELLQGDGDGATPLERYLAGLRSAPEAGLAFLAALGPSRFAAVVGAASAVATARHRPGVDEDPRAAAADRLLGALASLWALGRACGNCRTAAWDAVVTHAPAAGAVSLLMAAAATAGAVRPEELAHWGAHVWRRLVGSLGELGWSDPERLGDRILSALSGDGRAARRFVLELDGSDRSALVALVLNSVSSPTVSGGLLLASTNPGAVRTAADEDEVRRSLQAILPIIDRLLARHQAAFPSATGDAAVVMYGQVLPVGLGSYVGRELDHLVDPADGLGAVPSGIPSRAWSGWSERQVPGLLARLVRDPQVAAELGQAAWAGTMSRLSEADLLGASGPDAARTEGFVVGALDGVLGDRAFELAEAEQARFDGMVAGVDLVVNVVGLVVPVAGAAGVAVKAWGPVSAAGAMAGLRSPSELLLAPWAPASVREVTARREASEGLTDARLKGIVATIAFDQAAARGLLHGLPRPPDVGHEPDPAAADRTRPGGNANAAGAVHLAPLERWLAAADGTPVAATVEALEDAAGDAAAQGRRWIA